MPLLDFDAKRVSYWENADQRLDFTTMDNTAAFTAAAALDPSAPRILRIAGDQKSARELATVAEAENERVRQGRLELKPNIVTLSLNGALRIPRKKKVSPGGRSDTVVTTEAKPS